MEPVLFIIIGGILHLVVCALVSSIAGETKRSFVEYFFLSLIFTPFIGFILLALSMLAKIERAITSTQQAQTEGK